MRYVGVVFSNWSSSFIFSFLTGTNSLNYWGKRHPPRSLSLPYYCVIPCIFLSFMYAHTNTHKAHTQRNYSCGRFPDDPTASLQSVEKRCTICCVTMEIMITYPQCQNWIIKYYLKKAQLHGGFCPIVLVSILGRLPIFCWKIDFVCLPDANKTFAVLLIHILQKT